MTPNMDCIVTYRSTPQFPTGELLAKCLETFAETTKNTRLIIVDDNSDVPGAAYLDTTILPKYPNALLLRTGFQRWFTRAVNLGLQLVRTERCCVLNSDMVFGPGWLEEMVDVWDVVEKETNAKVGLVGSILSDEEPRRYQISTQPDYVTGHAWLLSMKALHEVAEKRGTPGRFLDERYPGSIHINSDVELCWVMGEIGWLCVKSFKSGVGHMGGRSWGHQVGILHSLRLEAVNERYV